MNNIFAIFTSDDKEEIKQAMKECIIEQMKEELEELRYSYIVDDEQLANMSTEIINEIKEEIKAEYKDMFRKQMEEKLKNI